MSDYFTNLRLELERAASRTAPGRPPRVFSWIASHLVITVVGGSLMAGGAGAAAVALRTATSDGPTGSLATTSAASPQSDLSYDLSVFPSLKVGEPGWCSTLSLRRTSHGASSRGAGCGPASTRGAHQILSGFTELGGEDGRFSYALVDHAVAYAQLTSGIRLTPRSDPRLPTGWRVLIAGPQENGPGSLPLFSADGAHLDPGDPGDRVQDQTVSTAKGPVPADALCSFGVPEGAIARMSRWLVHPTTSGQLQSPSFLPCAQTSLRYRGAWSEITILLDATDPGRAVPADLPGDAAPSSHAVELPAYSASYPEASGKLSPIDPVDDAPGFRASATRVGKTWVVVRGRSQSQRHEILTRIRFVNNLK